MPRSSHDKYDLAVFDIAGTTVDEGHAVYRALEESVRAAGADPSKDDIAQWMGADKTEAITALVPPGVDVPTTYADFRARLAAFYKEQPPVPLPGVADAIAQLRSAGVKVALTTGFSDDVTNEILATIGWTDGVVDAVVTAEQVGHGRPVPYMIFEAMRRTGCSDVRRVIVAGDTVLDLRSGANAGAGVVVGVLSGAMTEEQLKGEPHTALLDSVADIPGRYL